MHDHIDVREFGWIPGETADAGPALRRALRAARATGAGRLLMPPGDYHLWPETADQRELFVSNTVGLDPGHAVKSIGLLIEDLHGLEIVAPGARLVLHGRQSALAILDCTDIAIDGLEIDWAVPTAIDVTVADAGVDESGAWRMLRVPECTRFRIDGTDVVWISETSPFTGELYWSGRNSLAYCQVSEPHGDRSWRTACPLFEAVRSIRRIDANTLRVDYRTGAEPGDRGLTYQLREIERDHPGMLVLESRRVSLTDLRIRYLHGFGLVAQHGSDLTLRGVVFRPPTGSGRVTAGFADFVQCSGMSGRVEIRDCEFDGPHDDPINIHGTYLAVTAVIDPHTLRLDYRHEQTAGFPQFSIGETIELVHRDTLLPLHTATVTEVEGPTGRDAASSAQPMIVRLSEPLPAQAEASALAGAVAAENITRTPEVLITGCSFRHVPTRAILVTTRREVGIEGCEFRSIEMPCIQIAADAQDWWESGPVRDVHITGNTFRSVSAGVLEVAPGILRGAAAVHGRVTLAENLIVVDSPLLADLRGLRSLVATGNLLSWTDTNSADADPPIIRADAGVDVDWRTKPSGSLHPTILRSPR